MDKTGKMQDATVRGLALELYQSGISIFEHLQENPDKIGLARRFINYYLDGGGSFGKISKISLFESERRVC